MMLIEHSKIEMTVSFQIKLFGSILSQRTAIDALRRAGSPTEEIYLYQPIDVDVTYEYVV